MHRKTATLRALSLVLALTSASCFRFDSDRSRRVDGRIADAPIADAAISEAHGTDSRDGRPGDGHPDDRGHDGPRLDARRDGPHPDGPSADGPAWTLNLPLSCTGPSYPATTHTVTIGPLGSLPATVAAAQPGTTILLQDGTYKLTAAVPLDKPRLVLRGASGDRTKVILDGGGASQLLTISASDVVVADLSIVGCASKAIEVASPAGIIHGVSIYRVGVQDINGTMIDVLSTAAGAYADDGVIGCCALSISDAFRTKLGSGCGPNGIGVHQAQAWHVFSNTLTGFYGTSAWGYAAIAVGQGTRDMVIERNKLFQVADGIRFGLDSTSGRTYPGACKGVVSGWVDNVGGVVRNNIIANTAAVPCGDTGILVWNTCDGVVAHNTVFFASTPWLACITYRFPNVTATTLVTNNLYSHGAKLRGGTPTETGNVGGAPASYFQDVATGDLHLTAAAAGAIGKGASVAPGVCDDDFDGQPRGALRDVGADQR